MSSRTDFETLRSALLAIPDDQVIADPKRDMMDVAQEAENLLQWALEDRDALEKEGNLDPAILDSFEMRQGAYRYTQAIWDGWQKKRPDYVKLSMEMEAELRPLRDDLAAELRFRYHGNEDLQKRLDEVLEGDVQSDVVQQLHELYVLGKGNPGPLSETNLELLVDAAEKSESWTEVLAGRKADGSRKSVKGDRDRAYTWLVTAMAEIRRVGRHVFRKDPERLAGYQWPGSGKGAKDTGAVVEGKVGSQGSGGGATDARSQGM